MSTPTKNAALSALILAHMQQGASVPEAIDAVLGAGTYTKLAGDLYTALRAKHPTHR